ncbi:MAG: ABC transporter ATP-binding protein [Caldilineaceae bacterium]|uniref:ABC transporter ATP-binding protein n=1 Tax=Caldilineaceae bacterium SB0675_bin_29 TaxID=2605266 RepID=A0A6B1G4D6_9CHLR|nr:ABC transporter ATP-binding protein [Caldilineaceae bacterium]MYH63809.1 ABC transporter ATP-binding protein [Caldilineaceae bacterium SB0675_bin_29]
MQTMVEARNLRKTYKRADGSTIEAVKGVDLDILQGEIFSLLGPNGAGKTTTISMISGLVQPTEGDATIGGHSITKEPMAAKRLMGFVPQEIALYPELSARQNLAFFGRMYGMGGKKLSRRVDELLEFVDLADRQNDRIDTFSGGMKRRVNLAAGLLNSPPLIYMDEPTVGIDPQSRRRILDTVKLLRDEQDMTVLYTTHLMEEAQELSDRVAIIDHGQIIAMGTQDELTQQVGEEDRLEFTIGKQEIAETLLERIQQMTPGVTRVLYNPTEQLSDDSSESVPALMTVFAKRGRTALPQILQDLDSAGVEIQSVAVREPDLEAVFLALTGRALRD